MMLGSIGRRLQLIADFQRDCIELATLLPYPYEQITEAAKQVAYGSTHPNHQVAGHLLRLIKNKWIVEGTPAALRRNVVLVSPAECEQECLKRFYALLEEGKQK